VKLTFVDSTGKKSKVSAGSSIFVEKVNQVLIAQAIRVYLSNQRKSNSKVKTRAEVTRTKRKWYKQKGTGNARHGARTPNIFVGGGVSHGPTGNENWTLKLPKKMKKLAMRNVLTVQAENIILNDDFEKLGGKTKEAARLINKLAEKKEKVLVVLPVLNTAISRGLRNIEQVLVARASSLDTLTVASADKILMTTKSIKTLEERLK
jgi:large subunit ribosomal protein L4